MRRYMCILGAAALLAGCRAPCHLRAHNISRTETVSIHLGSLSALLVPDGKFDAETRRGPGASARIRLVRDGLEVGDPVSIHMERRSTVSVDIDVVNDRIVLQNLIVRPVFP